MELNANIQSLYDKLQISVFSSYFSPEIISGDIYSKVPTIVFLDYSNVVLHPKSQILILVSESNNKFSGFKSRCAIFFLCACSKPDNS